MTSTCSNIGTPDVKMNQDDTPYEVSLRRRKNGGGFNPEIKKEKQNILGDSDQYSEIVGQ